MGEVHGAEAWDLLEALDTSEDGSISTIHSATSTSPKSCWLNSPTTPGRNVTWVEWLTETAMIGHVPLRRHFSSLLPDTRS